MIGTARHSSRLLQQVGRRKTSSSRCGPSAVSRCFSQPVRALKHPDLAAFAVAAAPLPDPIDLDQPVASSSRLPFVSTSEPSIASDEELKYHFDHPRPYITSDFDANPGLFTLSVLTHPAVVARLTDRTLVHARKIVERICLAPQRTERELRLVVKNLDRLSDLLCGVIDMCELVRNVHPEEDWVEAGDAAYERLCSYMNELNTNQDLYEVSRVIQSGHYAGSCSSRSRQPCSIVTPCPSQRPSIKLL